MSWVKDQDDNWFFFSKSDEDGNHYVDYNAYTNWWVEKDGINYHFNEHGICLNPDATSNVGSSVFGLLYKYEKKLSTPIIILVSLVGILISLFCIYKYLKRKKRIN